MDMNEYQKEASRTFSTNSDLTTAALGLCGESGEVADIVKKHLTSELDKSKTYKLVAVEQ